MRQAFADVFLTKTRDAWAEIFEEQDACVYPVLSLAEAPNHPHMRARDVFVPFHKGYQPRSAPVFSATPLQHISHEADSGELTTDILLRIGLATDTIKAILSFVLV